MIVRIVKMTFKEEYTEDFKKFSLSLKDIIQNQEGCSFLEILQDTIDPKIFFTCSHWVSKEDLDRYRQSDFFKKVWFKAKQWFADKPEAWSLLKTENERDEHNKR